MAQRMMSSASYSSWMEAHNAEDVADGYDPDGADDFELLRESTKMARKPHGCDDCEWRIEPGQRYRECVGLDRGEFTITRHHEDREACAAGAVLAGAAEEARFKAEQEWQAAQWAEEFERQATLCDWCGADLGRRKQGGKPAELCARCFAQARDLDHPAVLAQAGDATGPHPARRGSAPPATTEDTMMDALTRSTGTDALADALLGIEFRDGEVVRQLSRLSSLRSLLIVCHRNEDAIEGDDPPAYREMMAEVEALLNDAEAALTRLGYIPQAERPVLGSCPTHAEDGEASF